MHHALSERVETIISDACSGDAAAARKYATDNVKSSVHLVSFWKAPLVKLKMMIGAAFAETMYSRMPRQEIKKMLLNIVGTVLENSIRLQKEKHGPTFPSEQLETVVRSELAAKLIRASSDYKYEKVRL